MNATNIQAVTDERRSFIRSICMTGVTLGSGFGRARAVVLDAWQSDIKHNLELLLQDCNAGADIDVIRQMIFSTPGPSIPLDIRSRNIAYIQENPFQFLSGPLAGYMHPPYDVEWCFGIDGGMRSLELKVTEVRGGRDSRSISYKAVLNTPAINYDDAYEEALKTGATEHDARTIGIARTQSGLFEDSRRFDALKHYWQAVASSERKNFPEIEEHVRRKHHISLSGYVRTIFECCGLRVGEAHAKNMASIIILAFPHRDNPNPAIIARARGLAI